MPGIDFAGVFFSAVQKILEDLGMFLLGFIEPLLAGKRNDAELMILVFCFLIERGHEIIGIHLNDLMMELCIKTDICFEVSALMQFLKLSDFVLEFFLM